LHGEGRRVGRIIRLLGGPYGFAQDGTPLLPMALAYLVYPEPGMRPMRDIDLLVRPAEARPAQLILRELGFTAPLPTSATLPDKHLTTATRLTAGFTISVEVHHTLFNAQQTSGKVPGLADLTGPPLSFSVGGQPASTLGPEDMLSHLAHHFIYHVNVVEPLRFIWIADLVGFAEQYRENIDWLRVRHQQPAILELLALLHFAVPLSERLRRQAGIIIGPEPAGLGLDFAGWPRTSLAQQWSKGLGQLLIDTFFPGEWWLRLGYGLGSTRSHFWSRWLSHPGYIMGCGLAVARNRLARWKHVSGSQWLPRRNHYAP
jgi:hypothetical protein